MKERKKGRKEGREEGREEGATRRIYPSISSGLSQSALSSTAQRAPKVPGGLIRDTESLTVLIKGLHVANITLYLGFFPASQPSHLLAENEGMGQHPRERSLLLGVSVCYLRKQVPGGLIQDTASLPVLIRRLHVANITASLGFFPASQPNHLLAR